MTEHYEPQLHSISELRKEYPNKPLLSLEALRIPPILGRAFWVVVGLVFLFTFLVLFAPWQQVSEGTGKVIAYSSENRQQSLEAPIQGRIENWLAQEGDKIEKNQAVVRLSDVDPNILNRLQNQKEALRLQLEAARQALRLSEKNLVRQKTLSQEGLSSERDFELAQIEVAQKEQEALAAETALNELEVRLSRQESQVVRSPSAGTLVRILVPEGGAVVQSGTALATIVPDTRDRAVELKVPGIDLPLISEGRKVRITFEGWPAVQFSGWPSVAVGTFGGRVEVIDAVDDGMGNYRVVVFPDPDDSPWPPVRYLRQGVRATGWILLDEVPLWWELWRRLNGFPKTTDEPV